MNMKRSLDIFLSERKCVDPAFGNNYPTQNQELRVAFEKKAENGIYLFDGQL